MVAPLLPIWPQSCHPQDTNGHPITNRHPHIYQLVDIRMFTNTIIHHIHAWSDSFNKYFPMFRFSTIFSGYKSKTNNLVCGKKLTNIMCEVILSHFYRVQPYALMLIIRKFNNHKFNGTVKKLILFCLCEYHSSFVLL